MVIVHNLYERHEGCTVVAILFAKAYSELCAHIQIYLRVYLDLFMFKKVFMPMFRFANQNKSIKCMQRSMKAQ